MFDILQNITSKVSNDYARLCADNAMGRLNAYLNGEIELITKTAKSNAVIEWFDDEFNEDKKLVAYYAVMALLMFYRAQIYI